MLSGPRGRCPPGCGCRRRARPHPGLCRPRVQPHRSPTVTGASRAESLAPHLSQPLGLHSCGNFRKPLRPCDLHKYEDMASAGHVPGPGQGSRGKGRCESLGAPQGDSGHGGWAVSGVGREPEQHGPRPTVRTLRPPRTGATPRPPVCPAPSPQQAASKTILREGERQAQGRPARSPPPRSSILDSFCFSERPFSSLVHPGGHPRFPPSPEEQSALTQEPRPLLWPPVSTRSPPGGLGGSDRQRDLWKCSSADSS